VSLQIESRPLGASHREIVLVGRLHADRAADLRAVMDEALGSARGVVFDARGLESIDAVALAVVVDGLKRRRQHGGEIVFFGLRPVVRRLFDLVALSGVVTIHAERDDAVRAMP
jgi:anti-anti-sigma factor